MNILTVHTETVSSPIRKTKSYGSMPSSPSCVAISVSSFPSFSKLEQGEYSVPHPNTLSPLEIDTSHSPQHTSTVSTHRHTPRPDMIVYYECARDYCCFAVCCLKTHTVGVVWRHRTEALNYFISIFLHVFLMIIFEIYFYFNFVVVIEKEVFIAKINSYFRDLGRYNHQKYSPYVVSLILKDTTYDALMERLYTKYMASITAQRELLALLLHQSVQIATIFCIVLLSLVGAGILHCRRIKWRWILAENVIMLGLLGCFEYLFFTTIILKYNPITDAELEYLVANNLYGYLVANDTAYNMTDVGRYIQ